MVEEISAGKPKVRIRYRPLLLTWMFLCGYAPIFPAFAQDLFFHIQEELPPGSTVGFIPRQPNVTYQFDGKPTRFSLNSQNGAITTTSRIDRDSLSTNPIELKIRSSLSSRTLLSVSVRVDDVNDNPPTFPSSVFALDILESVPMESRFPIDSASDIDSGENGTVDYAVISGNTAGKFRLGRNLAECNRSQICIITNGTLDREDVAFYQLNISASDHGIPFLQGHCLVNITILDFNDNSPVFTRKVYNGTVDENSMPGVKILSLSATDNDQGSNGEVRYYFEGADDSSIFHLNDTTGVISTNAFLDYEQKRSYIFEVIARDRPEGAPPRESKATVEISVRDLNEHVPELRVNFLTKTIPENGAVPTIVAFIIATDKDDPSGPNGHVNVTISNDKGSFKLVSQGKFYRLETVTALDYEFLSLYNITVTARDGGSPSKSDTSQVLVTVTDVNDEAPTFTSELYRTSITEKAANGSFVYCLNASDSDSGINSLISYSIFSGNSFMWFDIDSTSGLVTTIGTLDRELTPEISLVILARDHGSPTLNSTTVLRVALVDANDNPPEFTQHVFNTMLYENSSIGTTVITLNAVDEDIGDNGNVTYVIDSSSYEITSVLSVNERTGIMTTKGKLDRETKTSYNIPVIARDHGNPQLSSRTVVHLLVLDVNDNHPKFYPLTYVKSVLEEQLPQQVTQVTASDPDEGDNGRIVYSIIDGNDYGNFTIDKSSGIIRTLTPLDNEVQGLFRLNVTARDGGGLYAKQTALVEITVQNQLDNPPMFEHNLYNFSVYENVARGTYVGNVFATMKEGNNSISYSIVSGDPEHLFVVDGTGGIIMVDGVVDREQKDNYLLNIVAKVGTLRPLSAFTSVSIRVLDENDNRPVYKTDNVEVTIDGAFPLDKEIYHAAATDVDAGQNGIVQYQLSVDSGGLFKIDGTSGVVSLARKITNIDYSEYILPVLAFDLGAPPLHSTLILTIIIMTNHAPEFLVPSYSTWIPGNFPVGKRFLAVKAIDHDIGDSGVVKYGVAWKGNEEGLFNIFPGGTLYVRKQLNHAKNQVYTIMVTATDFGKPPLSNIVPVTVYIQNSHQHQALFENNTFHFSVLENQLPGTSVGNLVVKKTDSLTPREIVYNLFDVHGDFCVNSVTGEIHTTRMFDREELVAQTGQNVFTFHAKVSYNDTKVKQDISIVAVTVLDVNDNPPEFLRSAYYLSVKESSQSGEFLHSVVAFDPDQGTNADFGFSIVREFDTKLFHIDPKTGDLFLNGSFDREKFDYHTLTIRATDTSNSSLFSEVFLEIMVGDTNDNKPMFTQDQISVNISEDSPLFSQVAVVKATDMDDGFNSEIAYTISSGNMEASFDVNHLTGEVFLIRPLDYEQTTSYSLNISAFDRGQPPQSSSVLLKINVLDANDNAPRFSNKPATIRIIENVTLGTQIGQCSATDRDSGKNGQIRYTVDSQVPQTEMVFEVNPFTCVIRTRKRLDREDQMYYSLVIRATDSANPKSSQLFALKKINVVVDDINDNKPRFVSAPAVVIADNFPANSLVMTLSAQDLDNGANGLVTYSIESGNANFHLSNTTGKLYSQSIFPQDRLNVQLRVSARDNGNPYLKSEMTVTIFKKGQASTGPTFPMATYKGFVEENSFVGKVLLQVGASYSSSVPNNTLKYYITIDTSGGLFSIDEDTGYIKTAVELDRDRLPQSMFMLEVFAVDLRGPSPRTSSARVEIVVLDQNDNSPVFNSSVYRTSVVENLQPGAKVTTVYADDKDEGLNAVIEYSITASDSPGVFKINSTTGEIFTGLLLHRNPPAQYTLNVTARDYGVPSMNSSCVVIVTVIDVNNNSPQFVRSYYSFDVHEGVTIETPVGVISATDEDTGENSRITYSIVGNDKDVFSINPVSGTLTAATELDRERVSLYILNVSASDNGISYRLASYVQVYVNVLDQNDNTPRFLKSWYTASISEGAELFSNIVTMSAKDKDSGTNARITYTVLSGNKDKTFGIYPNGTIYSMKQFDRERKSSYVLNVMARDQAVPVVKRLSSIATVMINITDINDNKPYFISTNVTHVSEHAKYGDIVTRVVVVDSDAGNNSEISFSMVKLDRLAPFAVGSSDGVLRVSGNLDREARDRYAVKIIATDKGVPRQSADLTVTVLVDDYNDHAPAFHANTTEVLIREDISIGSEVTRFLATDADLGLNAEVRYSIVTGNEDRTFELNPVTGSLETVRALDRETTSKYILVIQASDHGLPQKFTDVEFTILLLDINDNIPTFAKPVYTTSVAENHVESNIFSLTAQDNDKGTNGSVFYEIINGNDSGVFTINSSTGAVALNHALNREKQSEYTLTVRATDGGIPPLTGETTVVVTVSDENDNPPLFQPNTISAFVSENKVAGTPVTIITATDDDAGSNANIKYSLANDNVRFAIDESTGKITTKISLDRERGGGSYTLEVVATDMGNPSMQGRAHVHVIVEDVNDENPVFSSNIYQATVAAGASPGTFVIMVQALDGDVGFNAQSDYMITSGLETPIFSIENTTGIISVAQNVPSNPPSYTLTVKASNVNAPQRMHTANVHLTVSGGPFPSFIHQDQSIRVSELAPIGTNLVKVNATGHTAYFIAAGNEGNVFEVDQVQGELKVRKVLDFEKQNNYVVIVGAKDGNNPPHSGFTSVYITVIDENDNPPVFNQSVYRVAISEDVPQNTTLLWLSATDADTAAFAEVEYYIMQEANRVNDTFGVSPRSGRIFSRVKLDREIIPSYTFKVRAEDVTNRSANSEAVVIVKLLDVDDNAPVFQGPLIASIYENASVESLVAELKARDADTEINAPLKFGFASGTNLDGVFDLHSASGKITLKKPLDREKQASYMLRVTVNDSQLTTTADFRVVVLDVNDNPPSFNPAFPFQQVREQSAIGSSVMNVTAVDDDVHLHAEVLYSILPSPASDFFTIDRQTGVLRPRILFSYEKPSLQGNSNFYNLTVKARNAYAPFYEATTDVVIEVIDVNDHAPVFEHSSYHLFATTNNQPKDSVGRVQAFDNEDDGVNAVVRYEIVSGNGSSLFTVIPERGNITVKGTLTNLGSFYIRVKAKDGGQPSMESFADVFVEVVEENLYSPAFSVNGQIGIPISESLAVGEQVVAVTASDKDTGSNGRVFYHIVGGDPSSEFGIGLKNGSIYVNKPLDYERITSYRLNVVAMDGGRLPKSQSVIVAITILNENDSPPEFVPQEYDAFVAENTPSGEPVVTVTAIDPDHLINTHITYDITNPQHKRFFAIDPVSGEVTSKIVFDFEVQQLYEVLIMASDGGNPALQSQTPGKLRVHITSVNEFTPKFTKSVYDVSVAENAPVGQSVTQISATDEDRGPDGEVLYELVGDSNSLGFTINQLTGVLSVSGKLDSEQASTITLRVIAKNLFQARVTPNTSDYATIVVTVMDANDAPRFLQSLYDSRASEGVNTGWIIANVTAVDDDDAKLQSGASLTYGILAGNDGATFAIDSATGVIRTAAKLDREKEARYQLTVTATDQGLPPMSGNATVLVIIEDVNDNAPYLVPMDCSGFVTENKPAGTSVITLVAQDSDLDPNRGPFTFNIFGSDYGKFQVNSKSGRITTTALLDRETTASYNLSIQVSDNGSPTQSAVSSCIILVQDENDNSPKSTTRVVHVNSFKEFMAGLVAKVPPEDPDVDDVMSCRIVQADSTLFSFHSSSCLLNSKSYIGSGEFYLHVNGSDGKSSVLYNIKVEFVAYNAETAKRSITVRIRNSSPEQFLEQSYQSFLSAVDSILPRGFVSQLFSVKSVGNAYTDLSVAVRNATNSVHYMDRQLLSALFFQRIRDLEHNGKVDIETVDYTPCIVESPCRNGGECTSFIQTRGTTTTIESIAVIFLSVEYDWRYKCFCKPGFTGDNCQLSDRCNSKPCMNGGTCVDQDSSYLCSCPVGITGTNCETAIDNCSPNPCKNGGRCENIFGSFKCHCKPGYLGKNCSSGFDFCQVAWCEMSSCTPGWTPDKCRCSSGASCQCACLGFNPVSYLELSTLQGQRQGTFNIISLEFSTVKSNGLLLYNTNGKYEKFSDFIALEIVNGNVRLSFNLGDTEHPTVVNVDREVADGQWHRVVVTRDGKVCATLFLFEQCRTR